MVMGNRRLTAILAADIAGYSALMGANEVSTVGDLKGHQSVVLPLISGFGGRVIDTAGDGILAEFASVLNAVKCAVAIQEMMLERNASVSPERRMQFRIGINQGDVMADDDRIYGDGINIAARLEGICDPGGICISGKVYDEIKGRFEIEFDNLGERTLKNIAEPVRTYRILPGLAAKARKPAVSGRPAINPMLAAAAGALVLAVGVGVALFGPWRISGSPTDVARNPAAAPQPASVHTSSGTVTASPAGQPGPAAGPPASGATQTAALPSGPFDGTWEVYQAGGTHCHLKTNRYRLVVRNGIVLASRPEPGRVSPDGAFIYSFPSLINPAITTDYAGKLSGDGGTGTYRAAKCEGTVELKRVSQ